MTTPVGRCHVVLASDINESPGGVLLPTLTEVVNRGHVVWVVAQR